MMRTDKLFAQRPVTNTEISSAILDQISDMVIVTDADIKSPDGLRILYVNKAVCDITGYQEAELLGQTPRIFQGADTDPAALQRLRTAITGGEVAEETVINYTASGTPYWNELKIFPIKDKNGEVIQFLSVQRDVTNRKQLIDELDKTQTIASLTERHFASARRAARIGTFDYAVEEDLQYWSPELIEMTGLDDRQFPVPGEVFISRIDERDRPEFDRLFSRAIDSGEGYSLTVRFHRPDGHMMRMLIIAEVENINGNKRIVGIARDRTDEIEAKTLLRLQEERFRTIASALSDVLWDYDIEKKQFWVNPDWPQKLRLDIDPESFDPMDWLDLVDAANRGSASSSFQDAIRSGQDIWRCVVPHTNRDGEKADIEINAVLQRDTSGRICRILGNARNVTIELRQQEGFTRSRALEAVGKMTGGIAHDLNNLLMVILGSAELLELGDLREPQSRQVKSIMKATESASDLTSRLLSFSGQSRLNAGQISMQDVLSNLRPLIRSALTPAIKLDLVAHDDVWAVEVDQGALEQAILNLAMNAHDAMPEGGLLSISCENHIAPSTPSGSLASLSAGRYVRISIKDTGVGMSDATVSHAMDPFFSTKDIGKGTGLGLSTVYGFTKQSGGDMEIFSSPGKGCEVILFLPASESTAHKTAPRLQQKNATIDHDKRGAKVLVVEDEAELRQHAERVLRDLGFKVTTAAHGKEALAILDKTDDFSLLFTDVIMPGGITGVQLANQAVKIVPQLKVVFSTGHTARAFDDFCLGADTEVGILKKPYSARDLIQTLNTVL